MKNCSMQKKARGYASGGLVDPFQPTAGEQSLLDDYNKRQAAESSRVGLIADTTPRGGAYQFGQTSPQGQGAQYEFAVKSLTDIAKANGQDPNAAQVPTLAGQSLRGQIPAGYQPPARRPAPNLMTIDPLTRGFADGGQVQETPEQLLARISGKYGVSAAPAPQPQVQAQPPVPQPAPQKPGGLLQGLTSTIQNRTKALKDAANYAHGGKIKGPGTPTSDSIPAQVQPTGEPINVSTGERIVSKAQDDYLQGLAKHMGFDSLDAMLEHGTGKPVGPTIKGGQKAAEYGALIPYNNPNWVPGGNPAMSGALPPPAPTTAVEPYTRPNWVPGGNPPPNALAEAGSGSIANAPKPAAPGSVAYRTGNAIGKAVGNYGGSVLRNAVPLIAAAQTMGDNGIHVQGTRESDPGYDEQSGVQRVGAAAKELALRAGDWGTKGVGILGDWALPKGTKTFNDAYREGVRQLDGVTAQIGQEIADQEAAMQPGAAQPNQPVVPVEAPQGIAPGAMLAGRAPGAVTADDQVAAEKYRSLVDAATGTGPGALQGPAAMQTRLNAYAANPSILAARNAGEQLRGSGARFEKGTDGRITITNAGDFDGSTKAPYTDIQGNPTTDWSKTPQYQQGLSDAARQRDMLSTIQRRRLDHEANSGEFRPQDAALANQGLARMDAEKAQGVQGQLIGQQVKQGQQQMDKSAQVNQLIAQASKETDPIKRNSLLETALAAQGKDMKDSRYIKLPNVKRYNDMGMITGEDEGGLFDTQTGTRVDMAGAKPAPDFSAYSKAYLAKRPGTSPDKIKADYQALHGAK